jgi:hypothetical protein
MLTVIRIRIRVLCAGLGLRGGANWVVGFLGLVAFARLRWLRGSDSAACQGRPGRRAEDFGGRPEALPG